MACIEEHYTSFSAPATLERKKTQSFLASAKEMFLKPWRQRSQRRPKRVRRQPKPHPHLPVPQIPEATTTSLTTFDEYSNNPFRQGFPNFQNRLAPIGGRPSPLAGRRNDDFVDGDANTEENEIKIPESSYATRPLLNNIFPMFDNASKAPEAKTTPPPKAVVEPKMAVKPQAAVVSEPAAAALPTIADMTPPPSNLPRRHSTPVTSTSNLLRATALDDRRASASSDTTADKCRQERRERRASLTRDIPMLPKRGQDPLQQLQPPPTYSDQGSPLISPYSEYTGPPLKEGVDYSDQRHRPVQRPPVAPGGGGGVGGSGGSKLQSSFSFPPMWPQPRQQLQELEEELEEDGEGDGEEEASATRIDEASVEFTPQKVGHKEASATRIDEVSVEFTPQKVGHKDDTAPPGKERKESGGGGFGRALKDVMSSKRRNEPVPGKPPGKGKGGKKGEEGENPEIKGFDDFFMY